MVGAWVSAFSRALHLVLLLPAPVLTPSVILCQGHRLSGRVAEAPECLRLRRLLGTTLSPQEAAVLLPHLLWAHTALSQRLKLYLGPEFISHPWASCFRGKAVSQSVLWPESYYCSKALMLKTARKITTENFHMK